MTQASKRTHRLAVAAMLSAVAAVLQFVEFSVKSRLLCKMLYNVFTISTYQN